MFHFQTLKIQTFSQKKKDEHPVIKKNLIKIFKNDKDVQEIVDYISSRFQLNKNYRNIEIQKVKIKIKYVTDFVYTE